VFCPEFYSFGKRPVDDKMVRGEEDRKTRNYNSMKIRRKRKIFGKL
jgi:hypothetical protein